MGFSRRQFLNVLGTTAGAAVIAPWLGSPFYPTPHFEATPLSIANFQALVDTTLSRAEALGCNYAGIVIVYRLEAAISGQTMPRDSAGITCAKAKDVPVVLEGESLRVGVHVVHAGVAGYAESPSLKEEFALLVERAVTDARANSALAPSTLRYHWVAPQLTDPADMSRRHRLTFRRAVLEAVRNQSGMFGPGSLVTIRGEDTTFVSTRGNCSHFTRVWET